ncbi:MAG: zinc-ribbon domain-containing protein [Clostridiales bacterium]|nr:zinc-ribbon domain-containing protein [Clostridiales bacterium]
MAYCSKCGTELRDDDIFCSKCGSKVSGDGRGNGEAASAPDEGNNDGSGQISKDMLIRDLTEYKRALSEKKVLESKLREYGAGGLFGGSDQILREHTFIKFYWHYLVAAPITFIAVMFFVMIMGVFAESAAMIYASYVVAMIAVAIVLLVGRSKALIAQSEANNSVLEHNKKIRDRMKEKALDDVAKEKIARARKVIKKYEDLIPVKYRNESSLNMIIRQLKITDAKTIDEVIAKMK